LLKTLSAYDQKAVFDIILRDVSRKYLQTSGTILTQSLSTPVDAAAIGGMAAMINGLVQNNSLLEAHLAHWLTSNSGDYAGLGLGARRAVIVTLAQKQGDVYFNIHFILLISRQTTCKMFLEEVWSILATRCRSSMALYFSKSVSNLMNAGLLSFWKFDRSCAYVYCPFVAAAQTILLMVGYLHRSNPESLKQMSSSGEFLHMVSNRLSASVPRARFLGMIVATAVSKLVDKADKTMNFGVDEIASEEALAWLELVKTDDRVGEMEDLKKAATLTSPKTERRRPASTIAQSLPKPARHGTKIVAIEEILDSDQENASSEEEDPELRPYGRPDSDAEDSDDDPTLVNRNKPSAPVYIISLIKQLNVSDDLPTTELALKTAPSLIRRKANFGDELSTNLLPLAASLLNLREGMSSDELQRLKVEALVACLVSKPEVMGPWIAGMYFEGDFSLSQRAALLAAAGLGTREIAGYDDSSAHYTSKGTNTLSAFPSNRLPPKLDILYASITSPISAISTDLSRRTLQPMALEAADKLTGPDILKVRTFSSRMDVQKKAAAKAEARSKRIPKDVHKVLADAIYLPLCSRLILVLSSLPTSPYLANSTLLHPSLLKLVLQTLGIIISTLGPHALQLPVVTRETLILLTQLHSIPTLAHDPIILPIVLQLLLTLLDLNVEAGTTAEERLVTEFGSMIAELISWSGSLGERVSIPEVDTNAGGEMPRPVLVAGIQVKWQEVGRKFQGRMLGLMAGTNFDSF